MTTHSKRLGTACFFAISLGLTPAMAEAPMGFAGTLGGDYTRTTCDGCGNNNAWGGQGSAAFGFSPQFGAEVDGSYHRLSSTGSDVDLWSIGGSGFFDFGQGRVGGTVNYDSFSGSGFSGHVTTYGGFGEFYAADLFTIAAKGGGLSASAGAFGGGASATGGYVSGAVLFYPIPDVNLTGAIDYVDISGGHITSYGVSGEWMVSEMVPVTIVGGYTHHDISGGFSADTWRIGLKIYTDGNGVTLVDKHRNGTLGWVGDASLGTRLAF